MTRLIDGATDRTARCCSTGEVMVTDFHGRVFADREGTQPIPVNEDGSFRSPEGGGLVWIDVRSGGVAR